MSVDHWDVVRKSLDAETAVDGRALASLGVLSERLASLKRNSELFSRVEFSPHVEQLKARCEAMAVV